MINRILGKIFGEYTVTGEMYEYTACLNILREKGLWKYNEKRDDGKFTFTLRKNDKRIFLSECERRGVQLTVSGIKGIPGFLYRYRKRYGAMIGATVFLISVFTSELFIWDFQVVGNENVSEGEIISLLERCGCSRGDFIPSVDFEMTANNFLLESDDIAWISVNMKSSLAVVEVSERKKGEAKEKYPYGTYANLTASEDAQIVLPEISSGKSAVNVGDVVRKGQLLACGAINVGETGVRYEYARGEVLGKVYREITAEVPVQNEKKVYTGRKTTKNIVKIFGKSKNLFVNSSIEYAKYDKIEDEHQVTFFGDVTVPIRINSVTYAEYEYQPEVLTEERARAMAQIEYTEDMASLLSEGEIVSVEKSEEFDGEVYRITGKIYMIKDIAVCSEFTVSDTAPEKE